MTRSKLPIGIQTFAQMREGDYYYVDKTPLIHRLVSEGRGYFLARPRRFGKSLLVDTIQELFQGNEALFRGLFVHDKWDWSARFPVIKIGFAGGAPKGRAALHEKIEEALEHNARRLGIACERSYGDRRCFAELIRTAHAQFDRPVVVLVDDYDKPILDNIRESGLALELREGLRDLYSVIKENDTHIHFALITGVSKFSRTHLFSELDNLVDISLSTEYATLCGYTEGDLERTFAPELAGLDRREIRRWYNGYRWLGEGVYNPYDLLLLFWEREFRPYWFETGAPAPAVEIIKERRVFLPRLVRIQTGAELLRRVDVDDIGTEALLFHAGCLAIKGVDEPVLGRWIYTLGFPNREVESSLNEALIPSLGLNPEQALGNRLGILAALRTRDFAALKERLDGLFGSISGSWYEANGMDQFDGFFACVFYSHLAAMGLELRVEESDSRGQVDIAVLFNGTIYLFELKVMETTGPTKALAQLRARDYAAKYREHNQPIHLIGVEFSKESRKITGFDVETDMQSTKIRPRLSQTAAGVATVE